MNIPTSTLNILVIVSLSIGALALLLALVLAFRLRRLRKAYAVLQGEGEVTSFVDAVNRHIAKVDALSKQFDESDRNFRIFAKDTASKFAEVDADLAASISRVAVVRFDAFEKLGGRLSFAAAMLDDHGDGLVVSSIHGRSETRIYAKGVRSGQSEHPLTPEERQAVARALGTISS